MKPIYASYYDSEEDARDCCDSVWEVSIFGRIGAALVMIESSRAMGKDSFEDDLDEIFRTLADRRVIETYDSEEKVPDSPWYTEHGWIDQADIERVECARRWETYAHDFCDECVIALANDDYSGIDSDRVAEIRAGVGSLMLGSIDFRERDDFSTRQCDCCRTRLAGARTHAVITRFVRACRR